MHCPTRCQNRWPHCHLSHRRSRRLNCPPSHCPNRCQNPRRGRRKTVDRYLNRWQSHSRCPSRCQNQSRCWKTLSLDSSSRRPRHCRSHFHYCFRFRFHFRYSLINSRSEGPSSVALTGVLVENTALHQWPWAFCNRAFVASSARPLSGNPFFFWKALIARAVPASRFPSIAPW